MPEDLHFENMPAACRRAFGPYTGVDVKDALLHAWDNCRDAVALIWLAAVRAHGEEGCRKVLEEVSRAKGRALERVTTPVTTIGQAAQARLVLHLDQAAEFVRDRKSGAARLNEWSQSLDMQEPREFWIEYVRRMDEVVEGVRMNLRAMALEWVASSNT